MSYSALSTYAVPESQIRLSPFSQKLFQADLTDSKVYLSRAANQLLLPWTLGDTTSASGYANRTACILDGMKVTHELDGNYLNVTVGRGCVIIDSTLLVFTEEETLTLDLSTYGNNSAPGPIILSIGFQWVENISRDNNPYYRLRYYDGLDVDPIGWDSRLDRLVLTTFSFSKTETVPNLVINNVPDPFARLSSSYVNIKGTDYEVAPLPTIFNHFMEATKQNYGRKLITTIAGTFNNWVEAPDPYEPDPIIGKTLYYHQVNISEIGHKDVQVFCYINDLMIAPAGVQLIDNESVKIWMPKMFVQKNPIPDLKLIIIG